jgi:hypothetical protein
METTSATTTGRIRFTPDELLKKYLEVQKAPEVLVKEMKEPPLSNLISHYYVKPVNFERDPFAAIGGFQKGNQQKPIYKRPQQQQHYQDA